MSRTWAGMFLYLLVATFGIEAAVAQQGGQAARPPELDAQYRRAEAAWKSGASLLEAKARLDRVLEALPNDLAARMLRAEVLLDMDRPEEAVADARRAVALAPDSGRTHLLLSEAARRSGDLELARSELDLAAEHLADEAALHIRLSWNAALLDQLDRAEAFARIALALDSTAASAYYQLARVFVRQDQPGQAATVLARGLRSSVLNAAAIREDSLLAQVASHPALREFIEE